VSMSNAREVTSRGKKVAHDRSIEVHQNIAGKRGRRGYGEKKQTPLQHGEWHEVEKDSSAV